MKFRRHCALKTLKLLFLTSFLSHQCHSKETEYHLITFSTDNYDTHANKLLGTARLGGFNQTRHFKPVDIDDLYVKRNHDVLYPHWPNGPGGWIWKPYVLLKYMLYEASDGDVVCYCDARYVLNGSIINRINRLIDAPPHIAIPTNKPKGKLYMEKWYSKGEAYAILGIDGSGIRNSYQAWAGFNCYRVTFIALQFVMEWFTYTQDGRIIHGHESHFTPNDVEFKDGRQDQTVLSLLAKKWKIKFFNLDEYFGLIDCRVSNC